LLEFKQCSASSYGTLGIGLRATKSLTASIGRQSRHLTESQAGCALFVELHCLEGALKKKEEKNRGEFSDIRQFRRLSWLGIVKKLSPSEDKATILELD
jgi:hypothetical protein